MLASFTESIQNKLRQVRLVLTDVDGVLTDGGLLYEADGEGVGLRFNVRDGYAMRALQRCGIQVGVVTGRQSLAVGRRMKDLGIQLVYQKVSDKRALLAEIAERVDIEPQYMAFIGDDMPDFEIMQAVGLAVCVQDAILALQQISDIRLQAAGGQGAFRELADLLLAAQNLSYL